MKFPGKFIAASVSFTLIFTAPGLQCYQAAAQSIGTGEVAPVRFSATNVGSNIPGEKSVFDLQPTLTSRLSATAGVAKVQLSAIPLTEQTVTVPASRPSLYLRTKRAFAQTLHRSAETATQEPAAGLSYESAALSNQSSISWKERGTALMKGLGELAFPQNWRDHVSDHLNRFFDFSRQQPALAYATADYGNSNFGSRKNLDNRWALQMSVVGDGSNSGNEDSDNGRGVAKTVKLQVPVNQSLDVEEILPPEFWLSPSLKQGANLAAIKSIESFINDAKIADGDESKILNSITSVRLKYISTIEVVGGIDVYTVNVKSSAYGEMIFNVEATGSPKTQVFEVTRIDKQRISEASANDPYIVAARLSKEVRARGVEAQVGLLESMPPQPIARFTSKKDFDKVANLFTEGPSKRLFYLGLGFGVRVSEDSSATSSHNPTSNAVETPQTPQNVSEKPLTKESIAAAARGFLSTKWGHFTETQRTGILTFLEQKVFSDSKFQKDPTAYLEQWHIRRGGLEMLITPNDQALSFLDFLEEHGQLKDFAASAAKVYGSRTQSPSSEAGFAVLGPTLFAGIASAIIMAQTAVNPTGNTVVGGSWNFFASIPQTAASSPLSALVGVSVGALLAVAGYLHIYEHKNFKKNVLGVGVTALLGLAIGSILFFMLAHSYIFTGGILAAIFAVIAFAGIMDALG